MVQEVFGPNNKTLINPFWHKPAETREVSQKLQVLVLRHLFLPFSFVYLLSQAKREQWSIHQQQILKKI